MSHLTVTVPTELLREFCDRIYTESSVQDQLKDVLEPQLPREIEEGCRVRVVCRDCAAGTCGKPFKGFVLVEHDDARICTWGLSELERID